MRHVGYVGVSQKHTHVHKSLSPFIDPKHPTSHVPALRSLLKSTPWLPFGLCYRLRRNLFFWFLFLFLFRIICLDFALDFQFPVSFVPFVIRLRFYLAFACTTTTSTNHKTVGPSLFHLHETKVCCTAVSATIATSRRRLAAAVEPAAAQRLAEAVLAAVAAVSQPMTTARMPVHRQMAAAAVVLAAAASVSQAQLGRALPQVWVLATATTAVSVDRALRWRPIVTRSVVGVSVSTMDRDAGFSATSPAGKKRRPVSFEDPFGCAKQFRNRISMVVLNFPCRHKEKGCSLRFAAVDLRRTGNVAGTQRRCGGPVAFHANRHAALGTDCRFDARRTAPVALGRFGTVSSS